MLVGDAVLLVGIKAIGKCQSLDIAVGLNPPVGVIKLKCNMGVEPLQSLDESLVRTNFLLTKL